MGTVQKKPCRNRHYIWTFLSESLDFNFTTLWKSATAQMNTTPLSAAQVYWWFKQSILYVLKFAAKINKVVNHVTALKLIQEPFQEAESYGIV